MSTFIRRYSRYLNEKAVSYRQVAFDFTKVKRGWVKLSLFLIPNGFKYFKMWTIEINRLWIMISGQFKIRILFFIWSISYALC